MGQRPGDHNHCHWHLLHLPHPDAPHPLLPPPRRPERCLWLRDQRPPHRLLVDLVGIQHLNSSFGALTFVRGFAALLGPPIAGFALDRLQTVAAPFTLSTIFLASSALIHLGVWLLVRLTDRRRDYEQI